MRTGEGAWLLESRGRGNQVAFKCSIQTAFSIAKRTEKKRRRI